MERVVRQLLGLPERNSRSTPFGRGGSSQAALRTSVYEPTNLLLVSGPEEKLKLVEGLVEALDTPAAKRAGNDRQPQQRNGRNAQRPDAGHLKWVKRGDWATLLRSDGAFQVRVLTPEQKARAEKAVAAYRKQREAYFQYQRSLLRGRGRGNFGRKEDPDAKPPKPPEKVERPTIATDLVRSEFYQVVDVNEDYVELKGDAGHFVLPATSIRLIVLGETGTLDRTTAPSRSSGSVIGGIIGSSSGVSAEEFLRSLGGGGRGGSSRPEGDSKQRR